MKGHIRPRASELNLQGSELTTKGEANESKYPLTTKRRWSHLAAPVGRYLGNCPIRSRVGLLPTKEVLDDKQEITTISEKDGSKWVSVRF